ncbi:MAG: DUF1178 family protein [Alphaproteobacteria bacterium]
MIVYDLRCRKGHGFETWFRDSAAYDEQAAAGKVTCPTCGSRRVEKAPMAPRVAKARGTDSAAVDQGTETAMLRAVHELRRQVEKNCDYVGPDFAEEARKIHYGETDARGIYGETSDDEARALNDEGVEFNRVPWPARHDS